MDLEKTGELLSRLRKECGMTQKQVRYTWGAPSSTSSSSYGFTYWNWDDGSMVSFRNGVVDYWFDAAN